MAREATSTDGSPKIRDIFCQVRTCGWDFHFKDFLLICCWLKTIIILPLPLPFFTTPSLFLLSVQHSYQCTLWSCRLTHTTQHHFTLHTQPCPTSNTPKTISFEPLEQLRQLQPEILFPSLFPPTCLQKSPVLSEALSALDRL